MQTYIIKSFRRFRDGVIFERQETGPYSGGYVYNNEEKRLNDFLCDSDYNIWSVVRQTGNPANAIFTVGDRIVTNDGTQIHKIIIEKSDVIFKLSGGTTANPTIRLMNAIKYVEPVKVNTTIKKTTRTNNDKFQEVLNEINIEFQDNGIRLEKTLKKTIITLGLEKFLVKFFKEYNEERNTILIEDAEIHTEAGKRRSLGDIYMICKYYFPECNLIEIINLLYVKLPTIITDGFRSSKCNQIRKRVWYFEDGSTNGVFDKTSNDEFGNPHKYYIDTLNSN